MCPTVSPNAPECFRQREQWQWIARVNGRSTSKRTPPHRQLPPSVSAMRRVYVGCGRAASAHGEALPRSAHRCVSDRLLGDPLPQVARLAHDRCVLPLLLGASLSVAARGLGGPPDRRRPFTLRRAAWIGG